jgi:hypothetical protein
VVTSLAFFGGAAFVAAASAGLRYLSQWAYAVNKEKPATILRRVTIASVVLAFLLCGFGASTLLEALYAHSRGVTVKTALPPYSNAVRPLPATAPSVAH